MATCPECDAEIEVDEFDVDKGDLISCPDCGSNLEVTSTSPLELEPADDDDDDDEDDDEEKEDEDDFDGRRAETKTTRRSPGRGLGRVTHAQAGTDTATAAGSRRPSTGIAGPLDSKRERTVRAAG